MSQTAEDKFAEEALDTLIITMSAWRRLRHNIEETGKKDPEKNGAIAAMMLALMDLTYQDAAADLAKQKKNMERNLEKIRENSKYGRVEE